MRSWLVISSFITMITFARTSDAADWHGSPAGNDANDGTLAAPPFLTPQKAVDVAQPGDTIHLAAGDYLRDVITRRSGTAAAPIRITGPANAVIRGAGGNSNR